MDRNTDERNRDRDRQRVVNSFLNEGEEILWMGQPYQKVKYRPQPFLVVFSLFWLGFAVFWTVTASAEGGFFGLFGLPFVCFGVGFVYTAFFGNKKTYQNTIYAITPQRAMIIVQKKNGTQFRDFYFATLPSVQILRMQGDCGTIEFRPDFAYGMPHNYYDYNGRRHYTSHTHVRVGGRYHTVGNTFSAFEMIDNVQEVYALISDRITKAHQPTDTNT